MVVASTASGGGVLVQFPEDALFDAQVFKYGLEDKISLRRRFFHACGKRYALSQRRGNLLGGQAVFAQDAEVALHPL